MAWSTPATAVSGGIIPAAGMNAVIANFAVLGNVWTAYTPVWSSSGTAPALLNGTLTGRYRQAGKTVDYQIVLTIGSTTTIGTGNYFFTLPPFAALFGNHTPVGYGNFFDTSAGTDFAHVAILQSTTLVSMNSAGTRVSATTPAVPAVGDIILISGTYEAA